MAHSRASSSSSSDDSDYYYSHTDPSDPQPQSQRASTLAHGLSTNDPTPVHHSPPPPDPPSVLTTLTRTSWLQSAVPSFSSFRSQASSIPLGRRTESGSLLASSPRPASLSFVPQASPRLADPPSRPSSLASPRTRSFSGVACPQSVPEESLPERKYSRSSYTFPPPEHDRPASIDALVTDSAASSTTHSHSRPSSIPIHSRYAQEQTMSHAPHRSASSIDSGSQYSFVNHHANGSADDGQQVPITLQFEGVQRTLSDDSLLSASDSHRNGARPKSPVAKLGTFFGWNSSTSADSPTTTFSDRSPSPQPSFVEQRRPSATLMEGTPITKARLTPPGLDVKMANSSGAQYFENPETPLLLGSSQTNAHVRELEKELSAISTELAGSIRREMDLEDELDRIRMEIPHIPHSDFATRRGSDYFSDSGASSSRYPISNPDERVEQLEIKLRKIEQEKAQLKVEMANRIQTELGRRRDLEEMVHHLEDQLQKRNDQETKGGSMEGRVGELESTLDETRRRLSQERSAKDNFEDLYSAMREDLAQHRSERDNLRDEVVPQLKARVEGLESEASSTQALTYENTRMQQELNALREEHRALLDSRRMSGQSIRGFGSIAEEDGGFFPRSHMSRSNSLVKNGPKRGGSITRSGSLKDRSEGRQRSGSVGPGAAAVLSSDGVKEIEDQRDALHKALQLLIKRYEKQNKEHQRAVKKLTTDKDRAEMVNAPKRTAYHREVSYLKDEVTSLRKRTEDALEQKWQYEKGLSGIKMDLDRAEQETRGLRIMLQEHDIIPRSASNSGLQEDDDADEKLQLSISAMERERDHARQAAADYRERADAGQSEPSQGLLSSAQRMDDLADQLEKEVQSSVELRDKLAKAVAKGEKDQRESTRQIEEMQKRLAGMEDSVLAAQQHSESTLGTHEAEVRRIEEASSPSLQRLQISIPDPKKLSPATSPMFKTSPTIGKRMTETSLLEASRTQMLERKVKELEGMLREAEEDMQTVVQRVNRSQIEVADLQTERDAALTQMRKLQQLIVEERERADALMP
nr:hypothetical protein CFP56_62717 [Quercus suber]